MHPHHLGALCATAAALCACSTPVTRSVTVSSRPAVASYIADRDTRYLLAPGDRRSPAPGPRSTDGRLAARGGASGTLPAMSPRASAGYAAVAAEARRGGLALYLMRRGNDTLALERAQWRGGTLVAALALGSGVRVDYSYSTNGGVGVSSRDLELRFSVPGDRGPRERFWAAISDDSVHSRTVHDGQTRYGAGAVIPNSMPYLDGSVALVEQVMLHVRRTGLRTSTVPLLVLANPSYVIEATVSFADDGSALMVVGSGVNHLRLDGQGRIVAGTLASGVEVERVTPP